MLRRLLPQLVLCSLLGGCADFSGIETRQHLADVAELQQRQLPTKTTAEGWWRQLSDVQLDRLISAAWENNPGLQTAMTRVQQARYYTQIASAENLPLTAIDANPQRLHASASQQSPYADHTYWNNRAVLDVSLNLDLWGKQKDAIAASIGQTRAAAAEALYVRQQLATAIVQSYAELNARYAQLDVAEAEAHRLQQMRQLLKRRQAAGIGDGQERERMSYAEARQRQSVSNLHAQIEVLQHQLAALSGLAPKAGAALQRPRIQSADNLALPSSLPADWAGRRPDLTAQRWRVEAAQQNIKGAKAAFYPNINLMAFLGFQTIGFGKFLDNNSGTQGVGAAISLPLFDQGRLRGRLGVETTRYDESVAAYNQTLLTALQQIADQASKLQGNAKQREDARLAALHAQRQYVASRRAYRAGISAMDPVLDAQARLLSAQEVRAVLDGQRISEYAALMLAIGGDIPQAGADGNSR